MATLLHFLRSLAITFLLVFVLAFGGIGSVLGCLMLLEWSPAAILSQPAYVGASQVLMTFGDGDRLDGIIAIALTLAFVAALLDSYKAYKRSQRSTWHIAGAAFDK